MNASGADTALPFSSGAREYSEIWEDNDNTRGTVLKIDLSKKISWYKDVKVAYCTCNYQNDGLYSSTSNASKTATAYTVSWSYDNTTGILTINTTSSRNHYGYYVVVG